MIFHSLFVPLQKCQNIFLCQLHSNVLFSWDMPLNKLYNPLFSFIYIVSIQNILYSLQLFNLLRICNFFHFLFQKVIQVGSFRLLACFKFIYEFIHLFFSVIHIIVVDILDEFINIFNITSEVHLFYELCDVRYNLTLGLLNLLVYKCLYFFKTFLLFDSIIQKLINVFHTFLEILFFFNSFYKLLHFFNIFLLLNFNSVFNLKLLTIFIDILNECLNLIKFLHQQISVHLI